MKSILSKRWMLCAVLGLLTVRSAWAVDSAEKIAKPTSSAPRIQLAILLDTSGSMEGLINQARTQLWKIVNELATAKRDGKVPHLEVALYEYGKNSIPKAQGYLRQIVPLTDDLDKISEELFALRTNGGSEYCGQVIAAATKGLRWSGSDDDLKLIFIAGNEPFTQGGVNYQDACPAAIAKGITVNTIFCGPEAEGIRTGWRHGAQLADGSFMHIDQDRQVAAVRTPFDQKLAKLSTQVNTTYVAFGREEMRKKLARRQVAADAAARKAAPAAAAERARFKAGGLYKASAWDLIDALKNGKIKLNDVKDEQLPKEMREMSLDQRKAYLSRKDKERGKLQTEIKQLSQKRKAYIAEQRKKQTAQSNNDTLDTAIINTIRKQATRKRFQFDKD